MKRILSALLVMIIYIGFLPNIEVSATDQNMNNPQITDYTDNQFFIEKLGVLFDKLVNNQYNYFTTTGTTCGNSKCSTCNTSNVTRQHPTISSLNVDYSSETYSCYGFAKWTFKYLYGEDATGVLDNPISRGSTNTTTVVASTYDGNSSAKKVIQQAKIGDILQSPKPHTMIFLKCDDNCFYVLHANWKWSNEGNNIVKVSKFSYDQFNKITVYRAHNYSNYEHTCTKYETYKNGSTKVLGACKECHTAYNWQDTFSRVANQTALLKSSKKNYKISVYNAPYEDATKTTSKNAISKFAIVGTVKNAYGNDWYAIDYSDDVKKVCYIAYISKSTLADNYDIVTTTGQEAKKYDSGNTSTKKHTHNYNYDNGRCYCGEKKISTQQTSAESTLKINLTKYPSRHTQGNNFGLRGTISSNYKIKKIYGYIKQNGNVIQSTEDTPNAKSVDVKNQNLNNNLIFDRLSSGNYTLEVQAVDAAGKVKKVSKDFTVVGKVEKVESTLSINLEKYPVALNAGSSFGLRGTVKSNYKISSVKGYVVDSNGKTHLSSIDKPNVTSMDIKNSALNNKLTFNTLPAGKYTLKVVAVDASGRKVEASKSFAVKAKESQSSNSQTTTDTGKAEKTKSTLKINLEKYPTTLTVKSSFGLRGTVQSNYKISSVKGYVVDSSGKTRLSSTDKPNATSMDIKTAALNNDLTFNTLPVGKYTLKIVAVDTSGKTVETSKSFTVKAKESQSSNSQTTTDTGKDEKTKSTLKINLEKYPTTLTVKSSFGLRGTVQSNYKISSVKGYVVDSNGKTRLSSTDKPNATSMDIKTAALNNDLTFNTLPVGKYTLKIVATDTSGKTVETSKSFTIKAKESQSSSSKAERTVTGIVNIPSSWDNLSIRSGPSTNYEIIGSMNQGARCTVYPDKASNGWYYVEYKGVRGYASGKQINLQ